MVNLELQRELMIKKKKYLDLDNMNLNPYLMKMYKN